MSTFVTSILSSAQPVTGIAPATPVVLSMGVSKLPKGLPATTFDTLTCTCLGEPGAPGAVTVINPLPPGVTVTWNVPLPLPDIGETEMLWLFDDAVQATPLPLLKVIEMVCGLVTSATLTPKLRMLWLNVRVPGSPGETD